LEKGIINSIYSQEESYVEVSENFSKPYEKITNPDNNGYGFNFIKLWYSKFGNK
jgi:hypothetical protein